MGFTTKRGRPKKPKEEISAKPKRVLARNQEVLDILYHKSLITSEEIWAGMHFRWLYTLKFGAPGISAAEVEHFYGREIKIEDHVWQKEREKEYRQAIIELHEIKAHKQVMNIAIFNIQPQFLQNNTKLKGQKKIVTNHKEYRLVVNGLEILCKLWGKDNSRYHRS